MSGSSLSRARARAARLRRERIPLTRQTRTALVAAVLFVASSLGIAATPIPYVAWAPGGAENIMGEADGKPTIAVDGAKVFPSTGELSLTTVSVTRVDSRLTLPEAVYDYWMPRRDVLPRDAIYPPGKSAGQVKAEETQMMDTSQDRAIVAALREAGFSLVRRPVITAVNSAGPADGKLLPGDLIVEVDGKKIDVVADVGKRIRAHKVGDQVVFSLIRDRKTMNVTVTTSKANQDPSVPVVGIMVENGYEYQPRVSFGVDPRIGGPSAGLVFALGVYEKLTDGDLLAGRKVAGTGTIDYEGNVGSIGGIQEKIAGAEKADATIFFVPADNCENVAGIKTDVRLVRVKTLHDAVVALDQLKDPAKAQEVPTC